MVYYAIQSRTKVTDIDDFGTSSKMSSGELNGSNHPDSVQRADYPPTTLDERKFYQLSLLFFHGPQKTHPQERDDIQDINNDISPFPLYAPLITVFFFLKRNEERMKKRQARVAVGRRPKEKWRTSRMKTVSGEWKLVQFNSRDCLTWRSLEVWRNGATRINLTWTVGEARILERQPIWASERWDVSDSLAQMTNAFCVSSTGHDFRWCQSSLASHPLLVGSVCHGSIRLIRLY